MKKRLRKADRHLRWSRAGVAGDWDPRQLALDGTRLMTFTAILALAVRVSIALITRTYFQPDEYFQALEPAHFIVFGYGDLTWEWTSKPPIRSILYPALNVPVYWILKILSLDQTFLLVCFEYFSLTCCD